MRASVVPKSSTVDSKCYAVGVVGRGKQKAAPKETLTVHQIVAYNFRRAREEEGWTQAQTSERLSEVLGYRLNQAGVSAIEKTYDSERRRNIDVAEVVAFSRCFGRPIGWFFLPPPGKGAAVVETPGPGPVDEMTDLPAAYLAKLVVGTPTGWDRFIERITEMLERDTDLTRGAMNDAFAGVQTRSWDQQIDLRRRAVQQATLARFASPEDDVITGMAALLVELVKSTPLGFAKLRDTDPAEALRVLAEGDQLVQPMIDQAAEKQRNRTASSVGFDQLVPIDPAEALGLRNAEER